MGKGRLECGSTCTAPVSVISRCLSKVKWGYSDSILTPGAIPILEDRLRFLEGTKLKAAI